MLLRFHLAFGIFFVNSLDLAKYGVKEVATEGRPSYNPKGIDVYKRQHEGRCVGNRVNAYTSDMDFHGGSKLSKLTYPIKTDVYKRQVPVRRTSGIPSQRTDNFRTTQTGKWRTAPHG